MPTPNPGSNSTRGAVQTLFIEKTPPRPESASRTRRLRRRTARFARHVTTPIAGSAPARGSPRGYLRGFPYRLEIMSFG